LLDNAPLLPDSVIQRVKKLSTTLLADALDSNGSMHCNIKPVSDVMTVAGIALTVDLRPGDNLFLHQAIYLGSKGYVLVVDGKGHTKNAYLGDLMANTAKAMGIEGVVIDGLVRDKDELKELNFPIFSKGFIPNGPFKDGPGEVNNTISCGGTTVNPGDLIVGDINGVVAVPKEKVNETLQKAEKKLAYEKKRIELIRTFQKGTMDASEIEPSWLKSKMANFGY